MAQMLKPVYLKNSELPSENEERITNFELLQAVSLCVEDAVKCIQLDRDLWRIYLAPVSDTVARLAGCYDDQDIRDLEVPPSYTLDRGSVGLCQERCGYRSFALQVSVVK